MAQIQGNLFYKHTTGQWRLLLVIIYNLLFSLLSDLPSAVTNFVSMNQPFCILDKTVENE